MTPNPKQRAIALADALVELVKGIGYVEVDAGATDPLIRRLSSARGPALQIRPMVRAGQARIALWQDTERAKLIALGDTGELASVLDWLTHGAPRESGAVLHVVKDPVDKPKPKPAIDRRAEGQTLLWAWVQALKSAELITESRKRSNLAEVWVGSDGYVLGNFWVAKHTTHVKLSLPNTRGRPPRVSSPLVQPGEGCQFPWQIVLKSEADIPEAVELVREQIAHDVERRKARRSEERGWNTRASRRG